MKKVVNITIGSIVFTVEEDAYAALSQYLESIRAHFSGLEEQGEIVDDVELGIAEKLNRYKKGKVVSTADVSSIIAEMGTIADFQEIDMNAGTGNGEQEGDGKPRKKLYRNVDDQVIAGVASGIAAYFGVDPVFIRLLFVISIFLNGFGVIAYLVLWIVMPAAETVTQKLEMQGDPVTLHQLEKMLKDKMPTDVQSRTSGFTHVLRVPFIVLKSLVNALRAVLSSLVPVLRCFLGGALLVGSGIAVLALTAAATGAHIAFNSELFAFPVHTFLTNTQYAIGLSSLYLLFLIPVVVGVILGWSILRRENKFTGTLLALFAVVWMSSVFGAGHVASVMVPEYQAYRNSVPDVTQEHALEAFSGVAVYSGDNVYIQKGDTYSVSFIGKEDVVMRRSYEVHNGVVTINDTKHDKVCLGCFQGSVDVVITTPKLTSVEATHSSHVITDEFEVESFTAKFLYSSYGELNVIAKRASVIAEHSSDIVLSGDIDELTARAFYSSDIDTRNLVNKKTSLAAEHSSRGTIGETDVLNVSARFSSTVEYAGDPELTSDISESSGLEPLF